MPVYMLDTDISSYVMKRSHDLVLEDCKGSRQRCLYLRHHKI